MKKMVQVEKIAALNSADLNSVTIIYPNSKYCSPNGGTY